MSFILETEHLIIRNFLPSDAKQLFGNHFEDDMQKWIPNESYADLSEAMDAISFYREKVDRACLPFVLAVEHKETGELIGDTGINEVDGKPGEVEIGYSVCKKHSGKGYAAEALRAMTDYAISEFSIRTLYGRVLKGNSASIRVLEKCGYVFYQEEHGAEDDPYGNGMLVYRKNT